MHSDHLNGRVAVGDDYEALSVSFDQHLAAENKSDKTRRVYLYVVKTLGAYLQRQRMPRTGAHIKREHVEACLIATLESSKPATARAVYKGCKQFFDWLVAEGEIKSSPLVNVNPPIVPEESPAVLILGQHRRLPCWIAICVNGAGTSTKTCRSSGSVTWGQ